MLQVILRNRYIFVSCLAVLWCFIFLVPKIGSHYRSSIDEIRETIVENPQKVIPESVRESQEKFKEILEDEVEYLHAGEFQQDGLCLDTVDGVVGSQPGLWKCHGEGRNQFWFILKKNSRLKNKDLCITGPVDLQTAGKVTLENCSVEENQAWIYESNGLRLSGSSLCIASDKKKVFVEKCSDDKSQRWELHTPAGM